MSDPIAARVDAFIAWQTEFCEAGSPEEHRVKLNAVTIWETVLAYFDKTEPATADAIRYGVRELPAELAPTIQSVARTQGIPTGLFYIDKPNTEPQSSNPDWITEADRERDTYRTRTEGK